jgi:hypothetical protein
VWILTGRMKAPSRNCRFSVMPSAPMPWLKGYRLPPVFQSGQTRMLSKLALAEAGQRR